VPEPAQVTVVWHVPPAPQDRPPQQSVTSLQVSPALPHPHTVGDSTEPGIVSTKAHFSPDTQVSLATEQKAMHWLPAHTSPRAQVSDVDVAAQAPPSPTVPAATHART
jgi:hypothetical protein